MSATIRINFILFSVIKYTFLYVYSSVSKNISRQVATQQKKPTHLPKTLYRFLPLSLIHKKKWTRVEQFFKNSGNVNSEVLLGELLILCVHVLKSKSHSLFFFFFFFLFFFFFFFFF